MSARAMPLAGTEYPSEVRESATGAGLFATRDLPVDTVVARFEGALVAPHEVPADEVRYALVIDADHWLVPRSSARFANHACDPNGYVRDTGEVVTRRRVAAGEELTFDYALVDLGEYLADPLAHVWDARWTFTCRCGSVQCRERIDGYTVVGNATSVPRPAPLAIVEVPGKGRGVVAARAIAKGERVDRSPVLVIPSKEWSHIESTAVHDFTFEWGDDAQDAAVALGLGSLINHSFAPNTVFERRYAAGEIEFVALRDIAVGEEVTTNYNGDPGDRSPLWFTVVE